jgi:S-adenosylmethionine:tRNA ribosyltransferase-isomerase
LTLKRPAGEGAAVRLSDFDFELPEERIALRPAEPRDAARLLRVPSRGEVEDLIVRDLPRLLCAGDVLVLNDTKVLPARLAGVRVREGATASVQCTLHRRLGPHRWSAFAKPGKRLREGDRIRFGGGQDRACLLGALYATVEAKAEDGEVILAFDLSGPDLDAAIAQAGVMPLPPYIAARRAEDERDRADYQTVYAREDGSVAAPTAGLHFTPDLLERLRHAGVEVAAVTLHVGGGTFLPVKTDEVSEHRMYAEYGEVSAATADRLNRARANGGRIVCVGTTSLRLLESAAGADGRIQPFAAETSIFITPGHRFRTADLLLTNFHLPRSTLFMLVSAFSGLERMRAAYAHAVERGYRFYSYGDACLLERAG